MSPQICAALADCNVRNRLAMIEPTMRGDLMRVIRAYSGQQTAPTVFVRLSEPRYAKLD
jgi:hypothetical protein